MLATITVLSLNSHKVGIPAPILRMCKQRIGGLSLPIWEKHVGSHCAQPDSKSMLFHPLPATPSPSQQSRHTQAPGDHQTQHEAHRSCEHKQRPLAPFTSSWGLPPPQPPCLPSQIAPLSSRNAKSGLNGEERPMAPALFRIDLIWTKYLHICYLSYL